MADHDCPTCGRSFTTRRGLGVHHSTVHDERLPNRDCSHCGDSFYSDYAKKYCSDACLAQSGSYAGSSNPNYSSAKSTTECLRCETTFEFYPSEKPGCYCSECVKDGDWRNPPVIEGPDHPRWNGGVLELDCDVCGSSVKRYPSNVCGEVVLCSRSCQGKWLSEEFTGDGHPNWRGGGNEDYGEGWREVRKRALERDNYQCTICGASRANLDRNPDVHHILPVRLFVKSAVLIVGDAHTLDNVVSLCPSCHRRAEFGHITNAELRCRAGIETSRTT